MCTPGRGCGRAEPSPRPSPWKGEGEELGVRVFHNPDHLPRRTSRSSLLALVGFVGLCLLVGAVSGGITASSVRTWYLTLTPPPGTPPNWLFAPVWTALYVLMGVSAWLIWRDLALPPPWRYGALRLWGWQLGLNALWTPAFFGLQSPALGLLVILALLMLVALTVRRFLQLNRVSGLLLVPYLAWVCYAAYLNAGFLWLNRAAG